MTDARDNLAGKNRTGIQQAPMRAAAKQERRWFNARANAVEISRGNELTQILAELNAALSPLGEPAVEVEAMDLVELDARNLRAR